MREFDRLVQTFADSIAAQTECILKADAKAGNRHAKRALAAFKELRAHGNEGRDALAVLLEHPRPDVRVTAASFLLRHRTEEALAVLREAAHGDGLTAFGATQSIKNWESGLWALDPLDDP